jgi:hypothetical protein
LVAAATVRASSLHEPLVTIGEAVARHIAHAQHAVLASSAWRLVHNFSVAPSASRPYVSTLGVRG